MKTSQPKAIASKHVIWRQIGQIENWPRPEVVAFLITILVLILYRQLSQPEGGDSAIWDYVAQSILRGQVPYRDVVEIKAPLSAYLSATAMFIGKSVGIRDVIAVRLLNVVMAGCLSTVTFLVGVTYLRSRLAAALAVVIPLIPSHFAEWILGGTEPKLPMILFGMLSLLLVAKRKPFWAGFFSMLSCLCWQPGLMFTGVALLIFSRYLTSWRDLALLKVILGAAVPLAILFLFFFRLGALADLWSWTVAFNLNVYAPETAKSLSETLALLWRVLIRVFRFDLLVVALGFVGLIAFSIERIKDRFKQVVSTDESNLFRDGLMIAPLTYLAFCLINFQSGPDLIPLFPFIGLFAGYLIVRLSGLGPRRRFAQVVPRLAFIAVLLLILFRAGTHRVTTGATLRDQDEQLSAVSKVLGPDDRIYVHGSVEILVLLNRPNLNPYIFLDRGKDNWIAKRTGGEFRGVIDEMESLAPKIVAISRLGKVAHRAELEHWVDDHYAKIGLPGHEGIYLRKQ